MADDQDRGAFTMLWIVSVLLSIGMGFMCLVALSENQEVAALFGLGGFGVGGLLATTYQLTRNRRRSRPSDEALEPLVERLQMLEQDQLRMAELEERVDFAERMLAKAEEHQPAVRSGEREPPLT